MSLAYRPDIDGLRAVAVGSVVLFHGGFSAFSGGFVGVDVFFVISGFLITSILYRDVAAGRFSLATFYDHRIRRIFPALFLVLAVVAGLAALVLMPRAMRFFSQSLVPSTLFFANIYFERVLDYFGQKAEEAPLLHLWSLAVEEQFYILFPLCLYALVRLFGRARAAAVIAIAALASLIYAQSIIASAPQAAFFLLPSRAWELLVGAVLALAGWAKAPDRQDGGVARWLPRGLSKTLFLWFPRGLALAGLLAILVPVFAYDRTTVFPGLAALPPVLGAAALLLAGAMAPRGAVVRLLSLAPVVYVGRISYSLYLWHWPLLVLGAAAKGAALSGVEAAGVILLSVALAAFSLHFVETPLRRPELLGGRRLARFAAAGAGLLVLAGMGWGAEKYGSRLWPVSIRAAAAEAVMDARGRFQTDCTAAPRQWTPQMGLAPVAGCALGPEAEKGRYDVLVWGDSHAGATFPGIGQIVADLGHTARLLSMHGCPPLIGGVPHRAHFPDGVCPSFDAAVLDEIRRVRPRLVILVGRWSMWTKWSGEELTLTSGEIPGGAARSHENSIRVFDHMLDRTLGTLRDLGVRVLLVGQPPEFVTAPAQCVVEREMAGADSSACLSQSQAEALRIVGLGNTMVKAAADRSADAGFFPLAEVFCGPKNCRGGEGLDIFYMDHDHLSAAGVRQVAQAGALRAQIAADLSGPDGARAAER